MNNELCIPFRIALISFSLYSLFFIHHSTSSAYAQGVDIGLYPPVIKIDTTPPSSVTSPLSIENNSDEEVTADIHYRLFRPSDKENGTLTYLTGKEGVPSPDPLLFQKVQVMENGHAIDSVRLAPKQQKNLEVHIGIDKRAVPADYYFSIIFLVKHSDESSANSDTSLDNQNATTTTGGIATNVLLSIGPKGKALGGIAEFSSPNFVSSGPIPFTLRVENKSEHSIAPTGAIFIKNIFGQYVGKVDMLPVSILRKSIRAIPDAKSIEENTLAAVYAQTTAGDKPIMLWPETFLIGPYTAGVYVKLADEGPVLTKTIYFFAFPWQGIIFLIILILIAVIIREKVKKRMK